MTNAGRHSEQEVEPPDRGASKEFLQRPDVRAGIEWAKSLIGSGGGRRGKTAAELRDDARERARMDPEA